MNLQWHEWVVLALCFILLFTPAIGFWWAGHIWEKKHKDSQKQAQEYYVATTNSDDED